MHVNADLDNGNCNSTGGTGSPVLLTTIAIQMTSKSPAKMGRRGNSQLTIDDQGNVVNMSVTSHVDGNYSFANLRAGTYSLTEVGPSGWTFSGSQAGNAGGTGLDMISGIVLGNGTQAANYFFGFFAQRSGHWALDQLTATPLPRCSAGTDRTRQRKPRPAGSDPSRAFSVQLKSGHRLNERSESVQ